MEKERRSEPREDLVIGRNAVLELLRSENPVECIFLQRGAGGSTGKIAAIARERGIVVKDAAPVKLDNLCGHAAHQGVVAQLASAQYATLEDILARAKASGEAPFLLMADGIEDPHNIGAIIRTAEAAGAHGLILPKRRSAGLSHIVAKTSAGAVSHLPVARVSNLAATVDLLQRLGVWFYAADMEGEPWCGVNYTGAICFVLGAEGSGISRLLREKCDFAVSLPMRGKINSLNVSVAAGILCYEAARQRLRLKGFSL